MEEIEEEKNAMPHELWWLLAWSITILIQTLNNYTGADIHKET